MIKAVREFERSLRTIPSSLGFAIELEHRHIQFMALGCAADDWDESLRVTIAVVACCTKDWETVHSFCRGLAAQGVARTEWLTKTEEHFIGR